MPPKYRIILQITHLQPPGCLQDPCSMLQPCLQIAGKQKEWERINVGKFIPHPRCKIYQGPQCPLFTHENILAMYGAGIFQTSDQPN